MRIKKQNRVLYIRDYDTNQPVTRQLTDSDKLQNGAHILSAYSSLMGPAEVQANANTPPIGGSFALCHLDWHFGVAGHPKDPEFDWRDSLRSSRSMAVQIRVDVPQCVEFLEVNADLMGLQPFNRVLVHTSGSGQMFSGLVGSAASSDVSEHLLGLIPVIGQFAALAAASVKLVAKSTTQDQQQKADDEAAQPFSLYRYTDPKGVRAIEWLISKSIVRQWGPLLKGSLDLAFFSTNPEPVQVMVTLCPRLGFKPNDDLAYVPTNADCKSAGLECTIPVSVCLPR